jgi:DNA-binding CsgD family transcriptional regulator
MRRNWSLLLRKSVQTGYKYQLQTARVGLRLAGGQDAQSRHEGARESHGRRRPFSHANVIAVRADAKISERQKECLRLVHNSYSSKEIGRKLGISHETVDQHVARAMKVLGASSRGDAARMLIASESAYPQELGNAPSSLVSSTEIAAPLLPERDWRQWFGPLGWLVPRQKGAANDLAFLQRLFLMIIMPLLIIMLAVGGLSSVETLSRIVRDQLQ